MSDTPLENKRMSVSNFIDIVTMRQTIKNQDTFILLHGVAGSGKSTLCLHLIAKYIKKKKKEFKEGKITWEPESHLSRHFRKYVASDPLEADEKIEELPAGSYLWVDEGTDTASWMDMMSKNQKEYMKTLQKSRDKKLFYLKNVPNMKLMNKNILQRSHYLLLMMGEHDGKSNTVYVFRNYDNSILRDSIPFGYKNIENDLLKNPYIDDNKTKLHNYLIRQPCCIAFFTFRAVNPKIYNLYDKLIKQPNMFKKAKKKKDIPYATYHKTKYAFDTLMYNLYNHDDKTLAQVQNLLTDKFGRALTSITSIRAWINKMAMMDVPPDVENKDLFEEDNKNLMKIEIDPEDEVDVDILEDE